MRLIPHLAAVRLILNRMIAACYAQTIGPSKSAWKNFFSVNIGYEMPIL
jgi:hypothetical protein